MRSKALIVGALIVAVLFLIRRTSPERTSTSGVIDNNPAASDTAPAQSTPPASPAIADEI